MILIMLRRSRPLEREMAGRFFTAYDRLVTVAAVAWLSKTVSTLGFDFAILPEDLLDELEA